MVPHGRKRLFSCPESKVRRVSAWFPTALYIAPQTLRGRDNLESERVRLHGHLRLGTLCLSACRIGLSNAVWEASRADLYFMP